MNRQEISMNAPSRLHAVLVGATVLVIVWGALAFGSVYRWAYTPLAAASALVGIAGLWAGRHGRPPLGALTVGFVLILAATGLQLVPLSLPALLRASPATDEFLSQYDFSYQLARAGDQYLRHPMSIAPGKTVIGAMLSAAFALFLCGTARLLSVVGARRVTRWLIGFGGVMALIAIAQRGLTAGEARPLIYGFWRPRFVSNPFGPFVNPNHFAGWMLMALPVAMASFLDELLQTIEAAAHRRDRFGLVASPAFGGLLLLGLANLVMGLSLVMARSRSAIAAFAVGCLLAGWVVVRRQTTTVARAATAVTILVLMIGMVGWAGVDTVVSKFTDSIQGRTPLATRLNAWRDTIAIIRRYPITGSGMNTYGTAMMVYQTSNPGLHFQEAHNDYLQLAAEGGVLVGIPILVTAGIFIRDVRRRFREAPKVGSTYFLRVGATVGLVTIAIQSLVEFSLQMPGNAALFALLAAITLHQSPNLHRSPSNSMDTP